MKNLLFAITLMISSSVFGQTTDGKYVNDVKSISAIIDAYYDVISGSSQDPWQFERDKYIHSENAVITKLDENGNGQSHSLEAEYIPLLISPKSAIVVFQLPGNKE